MTTALPAAAPLAASAHIEAAAHMSVFEFIAAMTGSLAWPLTALIAMWVFRRQWIALAGKIASFEGFGVKVNFGERAAELSAVSSEPTTARPQTTDIAPAETDTLSEPRRTSSRRSPMISAGMGTAEGKVVAAWLMIESTMREAADEHDIGPSFKPLELVFELQQVNAITAETASMIEEARQLRNAVVHGKAEGFTFLTAQSYAQSATNIAARIRVEAGLT